eukprot:1158532-Pelagomonas_calceolata.AAC.12
MEFAATSMMHGGNASWTERTSALINRNIRGQCPRGVCLKQGNKWSSPEQALYTSYPSYAHTFLGCPIGKQGVRA